MLPLPTRSVTFQSAIEAEPGEGRVFTDLVTVPAHIGRASGSERIAPGGGTSQIDAVCWSELVDSTNGIAAGGRVLDLETGDVWEILGLFHQRGLGLDHTRTELRATEGVA